MLEKSSSVVLTEEDMEAYNRGYVSQRLLDTWNLTYDQLRELLNNNNYRLVNNNEQS